MGLLLASQARAQSPAAAPGQATQPQTTSASPETSVGEVVVTASRRSENVQNVPISITALTAQALEQKAATSFFDYATSVPNLSFGNTAEGVSSSRAIAIRGIAGANTTGFYIDDTPVSESLDPKIVDVERIEVLRGPQGTLYGADSEGGTVRLITIQPSATTYEGRVHASLSGTDGADRPNAAVDAAVNVPVVQDRIGVRVVALHSYDAGYFTRTYGPAAGPTTTVQNVGRSEVTGASIAALFKVTDNFTITPRVLYQETKYNGFPFADVATTGAGVQTLTPRSLDQRRTFNVPESSTDKWLLATLDMKLTESYGTLSSSTSYFKRRAHDVEDETDFDAFAYGLKTPIAGPAELSNPVNEFTQEIRFSSAFPGPFQLVTGLFYQNNATQRYFPPDLLPGLNDAFGGALGTDLNITELISSRQVDKAFYAEGTLHVIGGLKAIAGARVFKVSSTGSFVGDGIVLGGPTTVAPQRTTEDGVQPKFSLQYQIAPGNQVYATAAKGFRPGGVNGVIPPGFGCAGDLAQLGISSASTNFYRSDSVWSYEAGAKTTLLNRRVTADVSAFRIDWDNIQQRVGLQCGFSFRGNAGRARSQGVEFETTARIIQGLSVNLGFGYTDATFTSSAPGTGFTEGTDVPQVPKYTLTLGGDYSFPVYDRFRGFVHGDFQYASSSLSVLNSGLDANGALVPRVRPSYEIANLRGGITFGRNEVAVFVKNVGNELANLSDALALAAELPGRARVSINQPRTVGVEFRSRF